FYITMSQAYNSSSTEHHTFHLVLQRVLYNLGLKCHRNAGKFVFIIAIALMTLCVALKSAKIDTDLELWIEESTRVQRELKYLKKTLGNGYGTTNQVIIQTPNSDKSSSSNILTVKSFMVHLEAMAVATQVSIELFDTQWKLKDLCYSPSVPTFDEHHVDMLLENIIPCAIKTPLDCFWEGAKLLGPDTSATAIPGLGLNFRWTALNPKTLVETARMAQPHAAFRYQHLLDWMQRAGINSGYLHKPCLDPTDPNCPITAPNKQTQTAPDIGAELTGGCYGFATNHMHWHETEIVGGVEKNKTGHIVKANAIQSTIQLMGERDMFEFWQNNQRVQGLDWSKEKAKIVLDTWQQRFRDEFEQFLAQSEPANDYNMRQMTSSSVNDIMKSFSTPDYWQVGFAFVSMVLWTCVTVPALSRDDPLSGDSQKETDIEVDDQPSPSSLSRRLRNKFQTIAVTFVGSLIVVLTIAASLGLSVFLGLSFNAATIQLLPVFTLCIGFHTLITSMHAMAVTQQQQRAQRQKRQQLQQHEQHQLVNITGQFLISSGPGILMTSLVCQIAFVAASIIPIPALRTFCWQVLMFIIVNTVTGLVFIPSLIAFVIRDSSHAEKHRETAVNITYRQNHAVTRNSDHSNISTTQQSSSEHDSHVSMSRMKNDLMNVQVESSVSPTFDISANIYSGGVNTTFTVSSNGGHSSANRSSSRSSIPTIRSPSPHTDLVTPTTDLPPNYEDVDLTMPDVAITDIHSAMLKSNIPTIKSCDFKSAVDKDKGAINQESCSTHSSDKLFLDRLCSSVLYKTVAIIASVIILLISITGVSRVSIGLDLSDVVPRNTSEYRFMIDQQKYFPVFNTFAATKGNFDYPNNQKLLHEYHEAFNRIEMIVNKDSNGALPRFWLSLFRDWLLELQDAFDRDRGNSSITANGWAPEASDESILAFKLIVQTGRLDNPIDKSLVNTARLVDEQGLINPKSFYHCLTAWASNDAFIYSTSEANIVPEPKTWIHDPQDLELKIPKSQPIAYVQTPYLMRMRDTEEMVQAIQETRAIQQKFEHRNLPNFPTGIPFTFWEQFVELDLHVAHAVAVSLLCIFLVLQVITVRISVSLLVTIVSFITVIELYGIMGHVGIRFNANTAVALIFATGISIIYTVQTVTGFLITEGTHSQRIAESMRATALPMLISLLCIMMGALSLMKSQFDYIIKFSQVFSLLILLAAINSFLVLPTLLAIMGPSSLPRYQHRQSPRDHQINRPATKNRISDLANSKQTLAHSGARNNKIKKPKSVPHNYYSKRRSSQRLQSQLSLSTISEESSSYKSSPTDLRMDFSINCYSHKP
ncbi:Protein patched, partial [Fragariocoptes setiger]